MHALQSSPSSHIAPFALRSRRPGDIAMRVVTWGHFGSRWVTLRHVESRWDHAVTPAGERLLQCPFCHKPFKNYHSLQRHANRLSHTPADEGTHCRKLPRVEDITVLPDRTAETVEDEPESKRQVDQSPMSARPRTADGLRLYCRSTREQSACISSSWSRFA